MIKPELVSFKICPFVQRSLITLLYKGIDFDITYIDLANKPDWFLKISPLGKVPLLKVGEEVLFESAVINEYLDEISPPSLHPVDPLLKAKNRAWIEFASALIMSQVQMNTAQDGESYEKCRQALVSNLKLLNEALGKGPYFNGESFSLVDTTYAPFFMRLFISEKKYDTGILNDCPRALAYGEALLSLSAVKKSVVPEFETLFSSFMKNKGGYVVSLWN